MAVVLTLNKQEQFTGEFPVTPQTGAMWRFNEATPMVADDVNYVLDSSGRGRHFEVKKWSGTTAALVNGRHGRYIRFNTNNPSTEQTYLYAKNDGSFFSNLGDRIAVGGWINPTTYSVGNTFCPIFNTRAGPGQPLLYISLYSGRPRMMLYNSTGGLICDQSETPTITFKNNGWYFMGNIIDLVANTTQYVIGDRSTGELWFGPLRAITGTLNPNCVADIEIGRHTTTYWYAGGLDDWFFETESQLTVDDLERYFKQSLMANGGDTSANVDAISQPGKVVLRRSGTYPESGELLTIASEYALEGKGRVAVTSEYTPGVTEISLVETSTSYDFGEWSDWMPSGENGALLSPPGTYIRFRVTLTTSDFDLTPRLVDIQLHDIPPPPHRKKLGFERPMVMNTDGQWEAVLERAYDIIVTSEVNGSDTLDFKLPFEDGKRLSLENEKMVQVGDEVYRIRTITDEKASDGSIVTSVYAEAAFYDLTYSAEKEPREFNAALADEPMHWALEGTSWEVGDVNVSTLRSWTCEEKNSLAILRMVQSLHGGDLVFDNKNRLVHLYVFSGKESGALFAYRKNLNNIKRVVDTRSLITRLYAYGKDGINFTSINDGKPYVEDYSFTSEIRVSTLDLSNFTNPYQMLEFTRMRMAEYGKPRVSYVLSVMDLSVLTGYEHEDWELGDIVTVDDRDLGLTINTRVIRRQYNVQEPWKTVLELSSKLRELGDSSNSAIADQLDQSNVMSQEIKDMVPFNLLRNSRADSGFAYWTNSGFELEPSGVTGNASFKAVGVSGSTKSMYQTIYPANRRSYTISAQIGSDDLQKGPNGQVGIEVVFEFEDGTTETRFIDLY